MPIDIRYHAISLLAVFLALALGILVGFATVDPGEIKRFVEEVKKDNERTRNENRAELESLRQQQKISLAFERVLLPLALKERLQGKRVAILLDYSPEHDSPAPSLEKVLENAGAKVTATVSLLPRLGKLKEKDVERMLVGRGVSAPPEIDPRSFLARRLGQRIAEGGSNLPFYLEKENLIRISQGSEFIRPVHAVVVVGGSAPEPEFIEMVEEPLLGGIRETGRRIVGCELSLDSGAAVEFFQRLDLTTVDCVDTYPGQVALVLAVAGEDGNFGTKETAERLLPDLQ
ncbi:MAG: copper transporter [Armatimonadetes bacterium]|nr:copper transporter [Armatimonadota bacterium]NIM23088.1 copper transporter [Armatimonadota bacterium]NIM66956.1 copper transporter [Armatimonadota bacterium]NIM75490.1 copper transporter [Armatimonadota bacterium]NIN05147.1 copper transporter [Armatimonadota bacterium]